MKNARILDGLPMIAYTLIAARDSGCFDVIYVSSDDDKILKIAKDYGAADILRPGYLSGGAVSSFSVVEHAVGKMPTTVENIAYLEPTAPLRTAATVAAMDPKSLSSTGLPVTSPMNHFRDAPTIR